MWSIAYPRHRIPDLTSGVSNRMKDPKEWKKVNELMQQRMLDFTPNFIIEIINIIGSIIIFLLENKLI